MHIRTAGVQFMRENPERFIESNTENSWLRYLNNMCIQRHYVVIALLSAVSSAHAPVDHLCNSMRFSFGLQ